MLLSLLILSSKVYLPWVIRVVIWGKVKAVYFSSYEAKIKGFTQSQSDFLATWLKLSIYILAGFATCPKSTGDSVKVRLLQEEARWNERQSENCEHIWF